MCMMMRGVEKQGSQTVTRCLLGCFQEEKTKGDFLRMLGK